jgi:hypothetical protein
LVVVAVVMVLTGLNVNGSSVGILSAKGAKDPSLLAGTPRVVRSDEAALSTPNVVGNIRRGLPDQPWIGLTPTYLPASALDVPSVHWTEAFKPQDWSFAALGISRGFTLRWWAPVAIAVLGLFALLVALTRRGWIVAGLAVVGGFTPYVAWWSLIPGLALGYLAGGCALAVLALRARSPGRAVLLALGAGYLVVAATLQLYPPWLVSIAWVVAGILVGAAIDARVSWRRLLVTAGAAAAVVVPTLLVWYVQGAAAIAAQAGTYYPGDRVSEGGEGVVSWLFDAPANPWVAAAPSRALRGGAVSVLGEMTMSNQSEQASVWLPLPILAVLVVAVLLALRRTTRAAAAAGFQQVAGEVGQAVDDGARAEGEPVGEPMAVELVAPPSPGVVPPESASGPHSDDGNTLPALFWTTIGTTCSLLVLLAWSLLPLPAWFGRITLLDRVPGVRVPLALGLGATVLLAIGAEVLGRTRKTWPWVAAWVLAVAVTIWVMTWAGRALPWGDVEQPPVQQLLAVSALFAVGFALLAWRRAAPYAVALLVVGSISSWVLVNPWYVGLGPLTTDPVVRAMAPLAEGTHPARVAVYGPETLAALVQSSGVEMLSDLTVYPDASVWESLAPTQRYFWNNYAKYQWVADPTVGPTAVIQPIQGTVQRLLIDPCAPRTLDLDINWAVSARPLVGYPCLFPYDVIVRGPAKKQQLVYRYKVIDDDETVDDLQR